MSTFKQRTVDALSTTRAVGDPNGMSTSDYLTLHEMFPASPINGSGVVLTRTSLEEIANDLILGGAGAAGIVNDGGYWGFVTPYNKNYVGAPNIPAIQTGGGGLPGIPWAPAPGSPGPGSMSATDIPAPPSSWPGTPSGIDGHASPSDTSKVISEKTLGSYGLGTSS